jgi:predicted SprT family Zn-dependent metalloprotease
MTSSEREQIRQIVLRVCYANWQALQQAYGPRLGEMPEIQVNGRLTSTAGRCWQPEQVCDFSIPFLLHSAETRVHMVKQVIPHELAHAADWQLYGESEVKHGHGRRWAEIMRVLGCAPERFHHMRLTE